jgi:hypothetical protein
MRHVVRRPTLTAPADGFLLQDWFQVAYVTTDIERAKQVLGERYGLTAYKDNSADLPEGDGHMWVALAWAGPTMYEIIQAEGPDCEFYTRRLPKDGFAIRHHHLGYLVDSEAAWAGLEARIARESLTVPLQSNMPGFLRALYVEAPELGHYLEYIFPEAAGVEFLESAPNN